MDISMRRKPAGVAAAEADAARAGRVEEDASMMRKVLLIGILAVAVGFAQRGGGGGGRGGGDMGASMGMRGPMNRLDMIANMFTLEKEQKKDLKTAFDESQKEAAPLRDQLSKSRLAIGDGVQAGKTGADLEGLLKANAALEAEMSAIEAKAFVKFFKMLTKEQQAKAGAVFMMMKGMFAGKNWVNAE
jgi:hypothetical protein